MSANLYVGQNVGQSRQYLKIHNKINCLETSSESTLNENIFDQDDTLMVVTEMSDGTNSVFAVTVQQIWGQSGLHVIDFIGFFESEAAAQTAIKQADYVTYDES